MGRSIRDTNNTICDEDWQIGVASVHGLAAGVIEHVETETRFGLEDDLHDVPIAFSGSVRTTTVAVRQSRGSRPVDRHALIVRDPRQLSTGRAEHEHVMPVAGQEIRPATAPVNTPQRAAA